MLVSELEKVPPEKAGEFSPETIRDLLDISLDYARQLHRKYLSGHWKNHVFSESQKKDEDISPESAMRCRSEKEE